MNNLVHQYNKKIETNPKAPKFKVNDRVRITNYKNIFSNVCTKNWSKKIIIDSAVKTNSWTNKIEDLNGEKIIGIFMKKNCC